MIKQLSTDSSIYEMNKVLEEEGVFLIKNYLNEKDTMSLREFSLNEINTKGGKYPFGKNFKGPALSHYKKETPFRTVFDVQWMKDLYTLYTSESVNNFGTSIVATHDFKYDGNLARNGYLHFDRQSALKFFIYLTDVQESNGAFYAVPKTNKIGKDLRIKAWGTKKSHRIWDKNFIYKSLFYKKKYASIKNRIGLDYPNLKLNQNPIPVEAFAGTLIVFDSDTFHKGGQIEGNGKERVVVRLHSYKY